MHFEKSQNRILSLQHIPKAKDIRFHNEMLVKFEARPKGPKAEARGYKAETEANILALKLVWPQFLTFFVYHYSARNAIKV